MSRPFPVLASSQAPRNVNLKPQLEEDEAYIPQNVPKQQQQGGMFQAQQRPLNSSQPFQDSPYTTSTTNTFQSIQQRNSVGTSSNNNNSSSKPPTTQLNQRPSIPPQTFPKPQMAQPIQLNSATIIDTVDYSGPSFPKPQIALARPVNATIIDSVAYAGSNLPKPQVAQPVQLNSSNIVDTIEYSGPMPPKPQAGQSKPVMNATLIDTVAVAGNAYPKPQLAQAKPLIIVNVNQADGNNSNMKPQMAQPVQLNTVMSGTNFPKPQVAEPVRLKVQTPPFNPQITQDNVNIQELESSLDAEISGLDDAVSELSAFNSALPSRKPSVSETPTISTSKIRATPEPQTPRRSHAPLPELFETGVEVDLSSMLNNLRMVTEANEPVIRRNSVVSPTRTPPSAFLSSNMHINEKSLDSRPSTLERLRRKSSVDSMTMPQIQTRTRAGSIAAALTPETRSKIVEEANKKLEGLAKEVKLEAESVHEGFIEIRTTEGDFFETRYQKLRSTAMELLQDEINYPLLLPLTVMFE